MVLGGSWGSPGGSPRGGLGGRCVLEVLKFFEGVLGGSRGGLGVGLGTSGGGGDWLVRWSAPGGSGGARSWRGVLGISSAILGRCSGTSSLQQPETEQ